MDNTRESAPLVSNEILAVIDIVAKEKGIDKSAIIEAIEESMLSVAQNKYGRDRRLSVRINRDTGEIEVMCEMVVVDKVTNHAVEIDQDGLRRAGLSGQVGDLVYEKLPSVNFSRISARNVRSAMINKITAIEREKQKNDFIGLVGHIVSGIVKRQNSSEVLIEINGVEGVLYRTSMMPHENFKNGDYARVLLQAINTKPDLPLLKLSRTHPDFLRRLFEQEVPEIYDGIVRIHSVARDPGSKSKIAVYASDPAIDPIGACVGIRGSRVQSIVSELRGEKIDIILWNSDLAMFVVNSFPNINVVRVVFDEDANVVDVVVPDEQFSNAIGRGGQNVKLASKLTGCSINIISESDDIKNTSRERDILLNLFMTSLDVDEMVARLLIREGFGSLEDIVEEDLEYLSGIPGFNNEIACEIQNRAQDYIKKIMQDLSVYCSENGVDLDILNYKMKVHALDKVLRFGSVKCLNDIGDLSADELTEISGGILNKRESEAIIMDIRSRWFD